MKLYTKDCLQKLREKIEICEVLSDFMESVCNKQSKIFLSTCPFHDGENFTFIGYTRSGIYECTECNAHGDSIDFLMTYQKMSWEKAIEYLADKYNVELEEAPKREGCGRPTSDRKRNVAKDLERVSSELHELSIFVLKLRRELDLTDPLQDDRSSGD